MGYEHDSVLDTHRTLRPKSSGLVDSQTVNCEVSVDGFFLYTDGVRTKEDEIRRITDASVKVELKEN